MGQSGWQHTEWEVSSGIILRVHVRSATDLHGKQMETPVGISGELLHFFEGGHAWQ